MIYKVTIKYTNSNEVLTFTNNAPEFDADEYYVRIYEKGTLVKLVAREAFSDLTISTQADPGTVVVGSFEVIQETTEKV